jgi:hypothetical protein
MKKWLAAILLIISVACNVIPCCQFDNCAGEEKELGTANHENEEEGACSPFFSCTTCSGFTQISKPVQLPQLFTQKQIHYTYNLINPLPDFAAVCWQPPRLG